LKVLKLTVLGLAVAAIAPSAAMAGTLPPTVATSYTNTPIGVGESSGITITVSEPPSGSTVTGVGFTDTLPTGVVLDNPVSETATNCGNFVDAATPGTLAITANSGDTTITVSGATVSASATKQCVLTFAVIGNTANSISTGPGPDDEDAYSGFTYLSGVPLSATADSGTTVSALDVLPDPVATVTLPKNNAKYKYGQVVKANYACSQPDYDATLWDASGQTLGIQDGGCFGTDDTTFNAINDGQAIDTTTPGVHSLDVSAYSFDGAVADTIVTWTVLPNNVFTLGKIGPLSGTKFPVVAKLPGKGTLSITLWKGKTKVAAGSITASKAGKDTDKLTLTKAGKKLKGHPKLELVASFKPKGGTTYTVDKSKVSL
jgi:hypothetical protein